MASRGDLDSRGCIRSVSNLCDCWQREGTAWGAAPRKGAVRGGAPDRPWTDWGSPGCCACAWLQRGHGGAGGRRRDRSVYWPGGSAALGRPGVLPRAPRGPPVSCTVPPRRPSPHVGVSPGRAWPAGGSWTLCCPLCLDPPGRLPRASLRSCAPRTGPLRVPVSLCAGQARWWARTAPCCPLRECRVPQSSLSAPCLSVLCTPPQSK